MDTTISITSIVHGIANAINKIRSIKGVIIRDTSSELFPLDIVSSSGALGGGVVVFPSTLTVVRATNGFFDDTIFSSTTDPANRGFIIIEYEL